MPKSISNLSGYINILKELRKTSSSGSVYFFRGQGQVHSEPTPKCFRNEGHRASEREMLLRFISQSPKEFSADYYAFDRIVRAQHYGIPTRLLDVTLNPLTALYFALAESANERGHVLAFSISEADLKFYNSDTVSCLANLAYLTEGERVEIRSSIPAIAKKHFGKLPIGWGRYKDEKPEIWSEYVEDFNKDPTVRRLVQFIKEEKPYFESRIQPTSLMRITAVLPKRSNQRISAQSGAFFIFGLSERNSTRPTKFLSKSIEIAPGKKGALLEELEAVGVSQATVYPELDKIAEGISRKSKF